jgi:hypothetical protein
VKEGLSIHTSLHLEDDRTFEIKAFTPGTLCIQNTITEEHDSQIHLTLYLGEESIDKLLVVLTDLRAAVRLADPEHPAERSEP